MSPLLAQFISEARDLLEKVGKGMLKLESHPGDADLLNEIFRIAHTLKGASGVFEFRAIIEVMHVAEDLLDAIRAGELLLSAEIVDAMLDGFDFVAGCIDTVEQEEHLPADRFVQAQPVAGRLRAFRPAAGGAQPAPAPNAIAASARQRPERLVKLSDEARRAAFLWALANDSEHLAFLTYTPDAGCFYNGDDPLHQVRQVSDLLALVIGERQPLPPLAEMDAYDCRLRFDVLSGAPVEELRELFLYTANQVTFDTVPPHWLVFPSGAPGSGPMYDDYAERAAGLIESGDGEALRRETHIVLELGNPDSYAASALRWMLAVVDGGAGDGIRKLLRALLHALLHGEMPGLPENLALEHAHASPPEVAAPVVVTQDSAEWTTFETLLRGQINILNLPCDKAVWEGRLLSVARAAQNCLHALGLAGWDGRFDEAVSLSRATHDPAPLAGLLAEAAGAFPPAVAVATTAVEETAATDEPATLEAVAQAAMEPGERERREQGTRVLKVDQARIDKLMDLIGEIIVAKNTLPYLAQRAERVHGVREMGRELKEYYAVINRISQELQGAIMQVRMLPASHVFQRFPRLVRDISRKLGKQIDLVMEGEETEADKNIIEMLADPMIHIIRNSMDHGIETPETRMAAGKPPRGTIRVKARQDGEFVVIEVHDDGKGIDPEVIKRKAYEKGLITEERLESIGDHEAVQLVFLAGFSTAEKISDLSGRGVGMDVVRTAIEHVGGTVELESRKGEGSSIRLNLPLSMAISHVMSVDVGDQPYGVPMDVVEETVKISPSEVFLIKDQEVFVLRDRIVPLVHARRLLEVEESGASAEDAELPVLVVRVHGELAGLVVDAFHEGVEIILKPLEGVLTSLGAYSGTAVLGDGRVMLVFNLKELL